MKIVKVGIVRRSCVDATPSFSFWLGLGRVFIYDHAGTIHGECLILVHAGLVPAAALCMALE